MVCRLMRATDLEPVNLVGEIRTAVADSLRTTVDGVLQALVKAKPTLSSERQPLTAITSRRVQGHTLGLDPGLVLDLVRDLAGLALGLARMTTQEKHLEMKLTSRGLVQERLQLQYLAPSSPTTTMNILAHRLTTKLVRHLVLEVRSVKAWIRITMVRAGIGHREGALARVG